MRTSLLVCCVFALHCFPGTLGLPVRRAGRYKAAPASEKFPDPKRRGKGPHTQDFVNEATNSSNSWNRPRCGVPDFPTQKDAHHRGRHRQRRFVLHGGRFDRTDLTYKINKFPWQMGEDKVRRVFREAVKIWSDVTPLTFTEIRSGTADIQIDFTSYYHGDSLPFDGTGGILAHAFFPKTHKQGEIHFDYDESWTLGNYMGTDLLQVAAHEFGHVLGLQHSHKPKTIMYEYYSFSYPLKLSEDDKQGIQYLYGAKPRVQTPPPTTPPPPPPPPPPPIYTETNEIPPNVCETDFDAASMIRGELFFFKAGYVWRIRDPAGSKHLESGYPALASRHWKGIPAKIDAAFEDKLGNIWFFKGDHFWVFEAETHIRGPESIRTLGLSISRIQAALRWGHDSNYNTYFFKSGSYWRFSPHEDRVETAHPRRMQDWSGIPNDVDAAFRDIHGYAHFIRGRLYWKFDPVGMNSLEGYPRYVGVDFFGCGREGRGLFCSLMQEMMSDSEAAAAMALSLTQEYFHIPVVTRTYTTACVLTTAAVQLEVITPFQLYFNPELIIRRYQIWRLITSFLFFGSLGFGFIFNIIFLYRYCRMLEEDCFRGRTADFVVLFLFGGILLTLLGLFANIFFLGQAFIIMLVYVWSKRHPLTPINFFGLLSFQAALLPWVLMGGSLLLGNPVVVDLLGMGVGHVYYYLEDVFPNQPGGRKLLTTPELLRVMFDEEEDTNHRLQEDEERQN